MSEHYEMDRERIRAKELKDAARHGALVSAAPPPANDELRARYDEDANRLFLALDKAESGSFLELDIIQEFLGRFAVQVAARARLEEHKRSCAYCQRDVQTCGRGRELSRGAELQKAVGDGKT